MAFKAGELKTTDTWLTPRWILDRLGMFDLDPCAAPSPRPWNTASKHYDITHGKDGLKLPWTGRVWLNPPYSNANPWAEKMAAHGRGIMCLAVRAETRRWMDCVWGAASAVLLLAPRTTFMTPDGLGTYGNVNQTALAAYGTSDANILKACGLNGVLIQKWRISKGVTE